MMKKLSVIIPAYNEENRITDTLEDVERTLSGRGFDYEILVINDGSFDGTAAVVESVAKRVPKLTLVSNSENRGKGWVTRQGMLMATGDVRLFMDADNSTNVAEIFRMLPYLEQGYDVVVGSRCIEGSNIAVKQPRFRIFLGWALRTIIHVLAPTGVVDSQCGFKAFSARAAEDVFPQQTIYRWVFDVEILLIARKVGLKIKEVPITWINNTESHITFSGMINMLWEIAKIRFGR